jgi:hypothetical protein
MTHRYLFTLGLALVFAAPTFARLGETEAQSQARYGAPVENSAPSRGKPLLPGARELTFQAGDWRIRAAFVDGATVRIEYTKVRDAETGSAPLPQEIEAILAAEKDRYHWREDAPPRGRNASRHRDEVPSRAAWIRSDRARALLHGSRMIIESRNAEDIEERLARAAAPALDAATAPKF